MFLVSYLLRLLSQWAASYHKTSYLIETVEYRTLYCPILRIWCHIGQKEKNKADHFYQDRKTQYVIVNTV